MLYELVAVVRPGRLSEVKEIVKTTGQLILQSQGVVRGIANWGTFLLTNPVKQTGSTAQSSVKYYSGHHFVMRFDASAKTQHLVRKTLGLDPRLLRFGVVKMGETLQDIKDVEGVAKWGGND